MVSKWIKENILDKGVENVRVFAQMGQIDTKLPFGVVVVARNKETWVECRIDENRYKVADGYKITLKALDERFSYEHYYQDDFESHVRSGYIILKENESTHIEHIKWTEPLYKDAYVLYEADIVV